VTNVTDAPHQDGDGEATPGPGPSQINLSGAAVAPARRALGPAGQAALPPVSPVPICAMQPHQARAPTEGATTRPQPPRGCGSPACPRDHRVGRPPSPQNLQYGTSDPADPPQRSTSVPSASPVRRQPRQRPQRGTPVPAPRPQGPVGASPVSPARDLAAGPPFPEPHQCPP